MTRINPPDYSIGFWLKREGGRREVPGTIDEALAFAEKTRTYFCEHGRRVERVEAHTISDGYPSDPLSTRRVATIEFRGREYMVRLGCQCGWAPSLRRALDMAFDSWDAQIIEARVYLEGKPDQWVVAEVPE